MGEYAWIRMERPPLRLVPPVWLCNCLVSTGVARDGSHHNEVIFLDDLFHLLGCLEVPEHIPADGLARCSKVEKEIAAPNRDDRATLGDKFGDLERFLDLALVACRDRLLNEHGNAREVLLDLHLDVTAGLEGASEHRRGTDDEGTGALLWSQVFDEIIEGLVDAGIAIGRDDERVTLFLEDGRGTLCRGVNESDDFEAQAKLATKE